VWLYSQTTQILKGIMVASVIAPTSNLHLLRSCGSGSIRLSVVPLVCHWYPIEATNAGAAKSTDEYTSVKHYVKNCSTFFTDSFSGIYSHETSENELLLYIDVVFST
jgi:hypothetical protein